MMGNKTISARRVEVRRRQVGLPPAVRIRPLWIALVLSVAVHLAAALLVALLPRMAPREAQSQQQGTVELLMVEQKGAEANQADQPRNPPPAQKPPERNDPPKRQKQTAEIAAPPPEAAPQRVQQSEPVNAEARVPPAEGEKETKLQPSRQPTQEPPIINLEGTDSESNAVVLGGDVLPAMKDDRFRNRPPAYPLEAELHGEHGSVTVVIHVAENGLATGAEVALSSGFDVLDQAAVTAVRKWHFRPAMKEGRAVPFDMPFRFIFEPY